MYMLIMFIFMYINIYIIIIYMYIYIVRQPASRESLTQVLSNCPD